MPTSDAARFMDYYRPGDPYKPLRWDELDEEFKRDGTRRHATRCAQIEETALKVGIQKPVTVRYGEVVNGHHRVIVAWRNGLPLPWLVETLPNSQQPVDVPEPEG